MSASRSLNLLSHTKKVPKPPKQTLSFGYPDERTLTAALGEEIPRFTVITENVNDTTYEADIDPIWDQGTYLTEISELDSVLLSTPSELPNPSICVPIKTEEIVCE